MQTKYKAAYRYNDFSIPVFNDKIKVGNSEISRIVGNQEQLFEFYIQNEIRAAHVIDVIDHLMHTSVSLLKSSNTNFNEMLNIPNRDPSMFFNIINNNKQFIRTIFDNYMTKVNIALENKMFFYSAKVCGKIMNTCLYYFDDIFVSKEIRQNTMNYIKSHLSLICSYLMKSHKLYRFKNKDDVMKLPGGMTVEPFTDLRIMLVTTLFYFVRTDNETMWSITNSIQDTTYHLLFVFAMEKCHNNIYLSKFQEFLTIVFGYASEITILNMIFRLNLLSDLSKFCMEYVHRESNKPDKSQFIFFYRELAVQIDKAAQRHGFDTLKRELKTSLNWTYYKAMLKDDIKDTSALLSDTSVYGWYKPKLQEHQTTNLSMDNESDHEENYKNMLRGDINAESSEKNTIKPQKIHVTKENIALVSHYMSSFNFEKKKLEKIKITMDKNIISTGKTLLQPTKPENSKIRTKDVFATNPEYQKPVASSRLLKTGNTIKFTKDNKKKTYESILPQLFDSNRADSVKMIGVQNNSFLKSAKSMMSSILNRRPSLANLRSNHKSVSNNSMFRIEKDKNVSEKRQSARRMTAKPSGFMSK